MMISKVDREIALNKTFSVFITGKNPEYVQNTKDKQILNSMLMNLLGYGFSVSSDLYKSLSCCDSESLTDIYRELEPNIKKMVSSDVNMENIMYPGFPEQVMAMDELEFYINAIVHYISGGTLYPDVEIPEKVKSLESGELRVLSETDESKFKDFMISLMASKKVLSANDTIYVLEYLTEDYDHIKDVPAMPNKENAASIYSMIANIKELTPEEIAGLLKSGMNTATDCLRFAFCIGGGSADLKSKSLKFNNRNKKIVMSVIEQSKCSKEDIMRHRVEWKKLAHNIGPHSFPMYQNAINIFDFACGKEKVETFNTRYESAVKNRDVQSVFNILSERPGEYVRHILVAMNIAKKEDKKLPGILNFAINKQNEILMKISNVETLFELKATIDNKKETLNNKKIVYKGNGFVLKDKKDFALLSEDYEKISESIKSVIIDRLRLLPALGNIYFDDRFNKVAMPSQTRESNSGLMSLPSESRFQIPEAKKYTVASVWWTNFGDTRVDIDLSASLFSKDGEMVQNAGVISYYNFREGAIGCTSGDITNGGDEDGCGVSESISIDNAEARKNKISYVLFTLNSYCGDKFSQLKNCRFLWQERDESLSQHELINPKAVNMSMDVRSDSVQCVPMIYDVDNDQMIWIDRSTGSEGPYTSNANSINFLTALMYKIDTSHPMYMSEVIALNAEARGNIVDSPDKADVVISDFEPAYDDVKEEEQEQEVEETDKKEAKKPRFISIFNRQEIEDTFVSDIK